MVTHNLRYAVEYGNRLLMMHQGGVVMDLKGKEKEELQVEDIELGENEIVRNISVNIRFYEGWDE